MEPLGLYLAVPFCRSKCSFCNFASGVMPRGGAAEYVALIAQEAALAAAGAGPSVDTVYWGGGTPTLLSPHLLRELGLALRRHFALAPDAEFTVEIAPGTLDAARLEALCELGMNRASLGVQSFVDAETRAVGRLHTAVIAAADVARLRAAGIGNISLDLIAGLPHQTPASWEATLRAALALQPSHVSVYMLEVDDDSRLGAELLAGGARYQAAAVPADDAIADMYERATDVLEAAGLGAYEISNFARPGCESRHNERYWTRRPYLGLGVDAHSYITAPRPLRFANPDTVEAWAAPLRAGRLPHRECTPVGPRQAREEAMFLGLRRHAGVVPPAEFRSLVGRLLDEGLLEPAGERVRLTRRGRMISNSVLAEFIAEGSPYACAV